MTRKLEELFNLPQDDTELDESVEETETIEHRQEIVTAEAMNNLEKIDQALPSVKGLEASDSEMDTLAAMAVESYQSLMDLGMNVEARLASEILGSASQFLGHAITAKNAKINKKLKMIDLQLKKLKLDQDRGDGSEGETSTGKMLDRNELLAEVLAQAKAAEESKKD